MWIFLGWAPKVVGRTQEEPELLLSHVEAHMQFGRVKRKCRPRAWEMRAPPGSVMSEARGSWTAIHSTHVLTG